MSVKHLELKLTTQGNGEMVDITPEVAEGVRGTGIQDGTVTVFCPGSTGAITTIEYEPGLKKDFPQAMERFAPREMTYQHDETWHDGNGHSHVRASTIGPSLTVPVAAGGLVLGTWQQIVFVDFDNRGRDRRIILTVMGE